MQSCRLKRIESLPQNNAVTKSAVVMMIRLLLLIAFTAAASAASFDNGGNPAVNLSADEWSTSADAVGTELPRAAKQLSYRRQLSQAAAAAVPKPLKPKRQTIKYTYLSKGDFFQINADQSDVNGFAYFYVWGSNSVVSSTDPASQNAPVQSIYLNFYSCKTSTDPVTGYIVSSDCIDIWGSSDSALKLTVDSKFNGAVSASFAGSKSVPNSDTPLPVTISLALTLPCNRVNITKYDSTCTSSTKSSGSSPVSRFRSEYKSGTTSCAIERGSVSGSIRVDVPGSDSIDILSFFKTAVTDFASATTGKTKDSSITISKGFVF